MQMTIKYFYFGLPFRDIEENTVHCSNCMFSLSTTLKGKVKNKSWYDITRRLPANFQTYHFWFMFPLFDTPGAENGQWFW